MKWPHMKSDSLTAIKRAHKHLGWLKSQRKCCQMIREGNKQLHKAWCELQIVNKEQFEDVIFSKQCTVQLDSHSELCFQKIREPRKLKQKPKHP